VILGLICHQEFHLSCNYFKLWTFFRWNNHCKL